jgi:lysophospholipase L1-like esterase
MRTVWFSSAILAVAALFAVGCEEDDPSDMMTGQFPSQPGQDSSVPSFDAAIPGADATVINPLGGADAAQVGPRPDAGAPDATSAIDAGASDARVSEAGAQPDGAVPSEAGAGGWSPCPGGGMPCKILPFGDSITYGLDSTRTSPSTGSYRVELFRKARAANQNITFVGAGMASGPTDVDGQPFPRANEGHSGWTVSDIANRVPSPALDDKPHITLLMIGTNDVTWGGGASTPAAIGRLVDELVSSDPNMLVVVAQITPRGSAAAGPMPHAGTEALNAGLPAEVERRASMGKHVLLVDMYTDFPMNGLSDFVHPNKVGYDWMAGVWYKAISPLLR